MKTTTSESPTPEPPPTTTKPGSNVDELTFLWDFDSGNLASVSASGPPDLRLYTLRPRRDCEGTPWEQHYCTWFYFKISGGRKDKIINFKIIGLNNQNSLFLNGYRPVCRCPHHHWHKLNGSCQFIKSTPSKSKKNHKGCQLLFSNRFDCPCGDMWIAFCYPYSFEDQQKDLDLLQNSVSPESVQFSRRILAYSLEGRPVELLSITAPSEKNVSHKPVVFVSARVHPGETPSSFIMKGFLEFLLSTDPRAQFLLRNYIFELVPMLNPDGVFAGNYRTDTQGANMNRVYGKECNSASFPQIWALKEHLTQFASEQIQSQDNPHNSCSRLQYYFDLHAHVAKKGICFFLIGNAPHSQSKAVAIGTFAKIMSINCPHFDLAACSFTPDNISRKYSKKTPASVALNRNKEGSGRAIVSNEFNVLYSFTCESNYGTGTWSSTCVASPLSPQTDSKQAPKYSCEHWKGMGKALAITVADMTTKNPSSRIRDNSNGFFNSIASVEKWVQDSLPSLRCIRIQPIESSSTKSTLEEEKNPKRAKGKKKKSLCALGSESQENTEIQFPSSQIFYKKGCSIVRIIA